ncbi:MAG: NADH dehydrogenase [ubiquinone] 1 alpha subcomplex assembly factor 1 [Arcticibacterium sp.]|jgi:NADH dehydrogenase [ubiquinone] 1 alpha subcomplex assembly factor 1
MLTQPVFDFNASSNIDEWRVVNDGVMGGRSNGNFEINPEGHASFSGQISLENNGGFSSVRYAFPKIDVSKKNEIVIRLKGDKKAYQLRIKDNSSIYYSYIFPFFTNGDWQNIQIPLNEFYPSFRGRKLDLPKFSGASIEEIVFLIGNKKAERFELLIDKIELK